MSQPTRLSWLTADLAIGTTLTPQHRRNRGTALGVPWFLALSGAAIERSHKRIDTSAAVAVRERLEPSLRRSRVGSRSPKAINAFHQIYENCAFWSVSSYDGASTRDQADQEQYDRNDEQHMDKGPDRIGADDSQQPRNQKNHRKCV